MKTPLSIYSSYRALAISTSIGSVLAWVSDVNSQAGCITLLAVQTIVFMSAAVYRSNKGKQSCLLARIESGKLIYILQKGNKTPLLIYGVEAPTKEQEGSKMTQKWLSDFLKSKHLTFTNVDDIEHYKGVQPSRFSNSSSYLYADGEDVALAGLRLGYLLINKRYKTPKIYQFSHIEAEAKQLGIHALNEQDPEQYRLKQQSKKSIRSEKSVNTPTGAARWV